MKGLGPINSRWIGAGVVHKPDGREGVITGTINPDLAYVRFGDDESPELIDVEDLTQ